MDCVQEQACTGLQQYFKRLRNNISLFKEVRAVLANIDVV